MKFKKEKCITDIKELLAVMVCVAIGLSIAGLFVIGIMGYPQYTVPIILISVVINHIYTRWFEHG